MSDSHNDNWESVVSRLTESRGKFISLHQKLLEEKSTTNEGDKEEMWKQYRILRESERDLRLCMRPTTIISGTENEKIAKSWKDEYRKDSFPILHHIKKAIDIYEADLDGEEYDKLVKEDNEYLLEEFVNFPFFNPDHWFKKENELPLLPIKGAGIPVWLLDRYREAVYSYVYGFNNAAIAMCRSIVEGIIDNRIGDNCNNNVDLKYKIDFFMKTVKDTEHKQVVWSTNSVRLLANAVLHNIKTSCKESKVKEALLKTRDFISMVY